MTRTPFRPILVLLPTVWVGLIVVATAIAGRQAVGIGLYAVSAAVYEVGSLICHQLPERSFYFAATQLPVCARCTGIYAGAAAGALVAGQSRMRARDIAMWAHARVLLLAAAAPTALTLIYEWVSGTMPGHWLRAGAGVPLGAMVMVVAIAAVSIDSAVEIH